MTATRLTGPDFHPPEGLMGGSVHSYERGLSPWHADAFPAEFKSRAPEQGKRAEGWFALDYWGNVISFVPDGTPWPPEAIIRPTVIVIGPEEEKT